MRSDDVPGAAELVSDSLQAVVARVGSLVRRPSSTRRRFCGVNTFPFDMVQNWSFGTPRAPEERLGALLALG